MKIDAKEHEFKDCTFIVGIKEPVVFKVYVFLNSRLTSLN